MTSRRAAVPSDDEPRPVVETIAELQKTLSEHQPPRPRLTAAATLLEETGEPMPSRDEMRHELLENRWEYMCPSRFLWARLDDFADQPAIYDELDRWSANPAGSNLVLFGPVGAGKTHAAVAACKPLVQKGLDMLFLPVDELLDRVWSRSEADALGELCGVDLLVIDDLGSEKKSDFATSRIYTIVNRRWMEERPTVVTTNGDPTVREGPESLEEMIGARTFSRLVGGSITLLVGGQDRRRGRK